MGTKQFYVTTAVSFTTIPRDEPPTKKKSVLREEEISRTCRFESCIEEFLLPLHKAFDLSSSFGTDMHFYRTDLSFTIAFLLFTLASLYVGYGWSRDTG